VIAVIARHRRHRKIRIVFLGRSADGTKYFVTESTSPDLGDDGDVGDRGD